MNIPLAKVTSQGIMKLFDANYCKAQLGQYTFPLIQLYTFMEHQAHKYHPTYLLLEKAASHLDSHRKPFH